MDRDEFYYLAPYLLSLLVSVGIFVYAWQHRYIRGARPFTWLVGGQILTALGFVFELISANLETKIFWDTFQWLTSAFLVTLPILVFAVQFSEHKVSAPSFTWGMVITFLGLFTAFVLTDSIHHLFYSNPRLTTDAPFAELTYDFTWPIYIYLLLYAYGANLYGIVLLARRAFQTSQGFHPQFLIVAFGFLIPLIFSVPALSNIQIAPQRDLTPVAHAVGSLIAAWGLFRYGLFDILPIAREHLFENTTDPVIVFDPRNRITDVNKAALTLLGKQRDEIIGRALKVVFTAWPSLIEVIHNPFVQKKEVFMMKDDTVLHFEINISPIYDNQKQLVGRLVTARDITRLKKLENDQRALSKEGEQSIEKRMKELQDTAERFRTIVENYSDFIVRWKPDGTRTFVNEAYCRYWGVTPEQALARNFLFHTTEENRPSIEEIIARLNSGEAESETEIYQLTKPDGSVAWHEWTDTAIRDEWGKLIEIQSAGRDLTERKRAEEKLNT